MSALDAGGSDALYEIALEEDVDQQYWDRRNHHGSHQRRPVRPKAAGSAELCQAQRKSPVCRILQEDDRPEEAVPGALELEYRNGRDCRPGEGQHYPEKCGEEAGA